MTENIFLNIFGNEILEQALYPIFFIISRIFCINIFNIFYNLVGFGRTFFLYQHKLIRGPKTRLPIELHLTEN